MNVLLSWEGSLPSEVLVCPSPFQFLRSPSVGLELVRFGRRVPFCHSFHAVCFQKGRVGQKIVDVEGEKKWEGNEGSLALRS